VGYDPTEKPGNPAELRAFLIGISKWAGTGTLAEMYL